MNDQEIRHISVGLKIREHSATEHTFEGYASVFNELIPSYNEVMLPGSFRRTLEIKHGKVWVFDEHDWKAKVAIGQSGREDNHGLFVKAGFITDVQRSREAEAYVRAAHENGLQMGISIGFRPIKWRVEPWNDMPDVTLHEEVELWEYSLVAFPANQNAQVTDVHKSPAAHIDDPALGAKQLGIPKRDDISPSAAEITRTLAAIRTGADLSTLDAELKKLTKLYSQ